MIVSIFVIVGDINVYIGFSMGVRKKKKHKMYYFNYIMPETWTHQNITETL